VAEHLHLSVYVEVLGGTGMSNVKSTTVVAVCGQVRKSEDFVMVGGAVVGGRLPGLGEEGRNLTCHKTGPPPGGHELGQHPAANDTVPTQRATQHGRAVFILGVFPPAGKTFPSVTYGFPSS
jgi:hypothetical protein